MRLSLACFSIYLAAGLTCFCYSYPSVSGTYERLTESQKKIIQSGKQIHFFQDEPGEPWPKTKAFQRVEATPEEVVAVLSDYARQEQYVHRVSSSKPIPTHDPAVTLVDYRMNLPSIVSAFFDPTYRMLEKVEFLGPDKGYQISWNLVRAKSIRRLEGRAWAEPLPGGATLLSYENLVEPVSNSFILRTSAVIASVKRGGGDALQSLVSRIEDEAKNNRALLDQQLDNLRKILK